MPPEKPEQPVKEPETPKEKVTKVTEAPTTNIAVLALARKIVRLYPIDYDDIGKHLSPGQQNEKDLIT